MGRYIDEILQPGEKVLFSTNAHWIFFLPAIAAGSWRSSSWLLSYQVPAGAPALLCLAMAAIAAHRRIVQDDHGLVPSLDHRNRRHRSAYHP